MARIRGNDLLVARSKTMGDLSLTAEQRSMHLYTAGATGSGKSKFLEYLIRQDIVNWRDSGCGLLLLDPHGAIYDGVMEWLASNSYIYDSRPVIPIDLRCDDWVVAYNLLRERDQVAASVVIDNMVDGLAYCWGAGGTNETPLLARTAATVFQALYEHKLTLVEALKILDFPNHDFRAGLAENIKDDTTRSNLERMNALRAADYHAETASTLNRFQRLLRNNILRAAFGQTEVSLDLRKAMDEGYIILVSLATAGGKVSEENARTFATLMLADLWTAAKERGKDKDNKPFYVTIDEFQDFVSPTIAENLDEARGFGLHLTLAHQFPSQLIEASRDYGQRIYDSIMENARNKVVFSMASRERNLTPLADWLYMGTFDPYKVKHELYSHKVMDYAEETRTVVSQGGTQASSRTNLRGSARGTGNVHTITSAGANDGAGGLALPAAQWAIADSQAASAVDTTADGESDMESESESSSEVPVWIPVFGKELSGVQFLSIDEQRFLAEQRIMLQKNRHATARFVEMDVPVALRTSDVAEIPASEETILEYRLEQLAKWSFMLSYEDAHQALEKRSATLALPKIATETEPMEYKRRVRVRATVKVDDES